MKNIIILILVSLFLFTFGLGFFSLWQTDEVIYTQLAKEIIQTGDWLTLHLNGSPWFIHPPLFMWLTAATGAIFGFSNFIARIWCAIFGIIGVITTYYFGKLLFNEKTGFFSGLILATTFQYMLQARFAIFDIPLIVLMLLAVYFFFVAYKGTQKNYYWLFYVFIGLAMLMKGPIGILLPVLVLLIFLFVSGDLPRVCGECHPIVWAFIAIVLGGWWYLAEYLIHGQVFFDRVIGYYTLNRFTGIVETHTGPFYYYIPIILLGLLPWTAFVFEGLINLWQNRKAKECFFILLWLGIGFVFFSAANTKLPGYIMSLYPYLALSIGYLIASKKKLDNSFIVLAFISLLLILLVFPLTNAALLKDNAGLGLALIPMVLVMGIGGIAATLVYFVTKKTPSALYLLVISMLLFLFIMAAYTSPIVETFKPGWG
ncbi:MAG: glycosyltransferase family 39 protein [Candidatus Saganbacteria bacterium]|nr:glycosyltransferase family 39 protein [Candidatus Saganbacteria bacterium]